MLTPEPSPRTLPFWAARVRLEMLPHRKPPPVNDTLQVPSNAAAVALGSWVICASERVGPLKGCEGVAGAEEYGPEVGTGFWTSVRAACRGSGGSPPWLKRTSREPSAPCWM